MKNVFVAKVLYEIADMLDMQDVQFKPQAYRRAARSIETLGKPIEDYVESGRLQDIPGVGEGIAKKVKELVETGRLEYYEKLKKKMPMDFEGMLAIEGMGPKTVKMLYKELDIKTLKDLERAAKKHKIREIKGLGPKTEQTILENIELARQKKRRTLLGIALPVAEDIKSQLQKQSTVKEIEVAGSLRRMKETIGDIDILVTSKRPSKVADFFTSMEDVDKIIVKGPTKCSVRLKNNIQVDLRIVKSKSFGSALMYFTGSKEHNISLRRLAMGKDWKLSEYGLFKGDDQIAGKTEKQVYSKLGMQFIPPEMRENTGEIELALKKKLPKLVSYDDIRGDLHMHTKWSDGSNTVEEMGRAAKSLGREYICIGDHAGRMRIAGGLNERQLKKQGKEIDKANKNLKGITILKGAEVDIERNGKLSIGNSMLKELDVVVASVHSIFRKGKEETTKRVIAAMENEHVDIIGHPTGRKINKKKPIELDFDRIFEASKETNTFLEINSQPKRLDLNDINTRAALEVGCRLVIDTDAHSGENLEFMKLGVAVARRGWAKRKDIINTLPLKKFLKLLD
jgi:DNA polymerase (family 10)